MRYTPVIFLAFLIFFHPCLSCSGHPANHPNPDSAYKVMFYNVENLFDVTNDSLTEDDDFTPSGNLHWTFKRYITKLNNLYKVIIAIGGWNPPDIIGLCEVENLGVLQDLIYKTPLAKFSFGIVHKNSPDRRGIDVALIYNKKTVRLIKAEFLTIKLKELHTRDILYAKVLLQADTCHVFVNHWPSRSSGQLETEPGRFAASQILRHTIDSVLSLDSQAGILIMGDFNDDPTDESLYSRLKATSPDGDIAPDQLYNLTRMPASGAVGGTLKYQGNWNAFDQIIVSGSLISGNGGLEADKNGYTIFQNAFMLEPDITYNGFKPFRTYNGFKYSGGFSDHLPVYIELTY